MKPSLLREQQLDRHIDIFEDTRHIVQPTGPTDERCKPDILKHGSDLVFALVEVFVPLALVYERFSANRRHDQGGDEGVKAGDAPGDVGVPGRERSHGGLGQVGTTEKTSGDGGEHDVQALLCGLAGHCLFTEFRDELLALLLEGGDQDLFFTSKAFVDRAKRDLRSRGHVPEAHRLETVALSELDGGLYDAFRTVIHESVPDLCLRHVKFLIPTSKATHVAVAIT